MPPKKKSKLPKDHGSITWFLFQNDALEDDPNENQSNPQITSLFEVAYPENQGNPQITSLSEVAYPEHMHRHPELNIDIASN